MITKRIYHTDTINALHRAHSLQAIDSMTSIPRPNLLGQGKRQTFSIPKRSPKSRFFVVELSSKSRTVLKDPIPMQSLFMGRTKFRLSCDVKCTGNFVDACFTDTVPAAAAYLRCWCDVIVE